MRLVGEENAVQSFVPRSIPAFCAVRLHFGRSVPSTATSLSGNERREDTWSAGRSDAVIRGKQQLTSRSISSSLWGRVPMRQAAYAHMTRRIGRASHTRKKSYAAPEAEGFMPPMGHTA